MSDNKGTRRPTGTFPTDTAAVPPEVSSEEFTEQVVRRVGTRSTVLDFITLVLQGFLGMLKGLMGGGSESDRISTK